MTRLLPLIFLVLPLIEIALFIVVGRGIGVLPTLALVLVAAIMGGILLRWQGLHMLGRLRANIDADTMPGQMLFDGMALALSALLLIIPGFLGDAVALLLLIPPLRNQLYKFLTRHIKVVETTASYRTRDDDGRPGPRSIDLDDSDWQRK